jgi:hypothetical protein
MCSRNEELVLADVHLAWGLETKLFQLYTESSEPTENQRRMWDDMKLNDRGALGVHWNFEFSDKYVAIPYWFISIFFALLCGLPWYRRRLNFSLRTFLIAFTVLAVLLGFVGWLLR